MNTKITFFIALCCITHVALAKPAQFYKPYKSSILVENIQPKLYLIKDVNVRLSSKTNSPDFQTEEQIKNRYIQKLNEELKQQNLLANEQTTQPIFVNFDIEQKRVFAGEDLKFLSPKVVGKYAHSTLIYKSTLVHNNVELAKLSSEEKISIGKKGSLSKIVRDLSGGGKPENELEDIDGFAHYMIEQLPQ